MEKSQLRIINIESNQTDGRCNHHQKKAYFFHFQCLFPFFIQDKIIRVKINRKKQHKNGYNPLDIGRIAHDAVIFYAESAGTCCTEGCCQCIKHRHSAQQQQNNLKHCHAHIDQIQNSCRMLYFGHQFSNGRSRAFCTHQIHMGSPGHGKNRQQKDQHTHTADPVGKASPEKHAAGQTFHLRQNTGTGGGKTGNRFK